MTKNIEQVYYKSWNDELKEGHENYWKDITDITTWIGYALVAPEYSDDKGLMPNSTMNVIHENKTGKIFLNVEFAFYDFVSDEYSYHEAAFDDNISFDEFELKRKILDVKIYRKTFKTALRLWPHYHTAIKELIEYNDYLIEKSDINDLIDQKIKDLLKEKEIFKFEQKIYNEKLYNILQEKQILKEICED